MQLLERWTHSGDKSIMMTQVVIICQQFTVACKIARKEKNELRSHWSTIWAPGLQLFQGFQSQATLVHHHVSKFVPSKLQKYAMLNLQWCIKVRYREKLCHQNLSLHSLLFLFLHFSPLPLCITYLYLLVCLSLCVGVFAYLSYLIVYLFRKVVLEVLAKIVA